MDRITAAFLERRESNLIEAVNSDALTQEEYEAAMEEIAVIQGLLLYCDATEEDAKK